MAPNFDDGNSLYNFVVRDVNGVKGMVDLGLEKVPEQYIQPQHERIDKLKASSYDRLPIDLSMLDGPQKVALEFLKASISMVRRILEVLMEKLGVTLEESRIDDLIGLKMVNMNFYPTCPNPDLTVGVGRHSDMGTLTMLLQDGIDGLYVKMEEDITSGGKKGEWVEIPPIPGALVINVGDTL
ncbi:scopoletin 8-hydroxylase [Vitis vinifera]|nr:scopoletin 8-hydroxylase [Vitis vinifera]